MIGEFTCNMGIIKLCKWWKNLFVTQVDDIVVIDSRTMRWLQPVTNGCPPPPRDNHSTTFDGKNRCTAWSTLLVFSQLEKWHKVWDGCSGGYACMLPSVSKIEKGQKRLLLAFLTILHPFALKIMKKLVTNCFSGSPHSPSDYMY